MSVTSISARMEIVRSPWALAVLSVAQFLVALDYSIIYVALPSIAHDLRFDSAVTQWVISAYAVLFAGLLMVGGRLADRVGAKRVFIIAIVLFGVTSGVGGAAQDGAILLAARGTQGFAAALLQPAVLGLLGTTFPAGPSRSRALAVWGSVGASGLAAGAILGGLLTTASWRLTFFVNVPLTLVCALGAARWFVQTGTLAHARRIPALASILGTGAVLTLVAGLSLGAEQGWNGASARILLGMALLLILGFLLNERRSRNVLIERSLRSIRSIGVGSAATALYMASVGSEFYLVTLLLQSVRGYTPLEAGFAFLPLALMVMCGSFAAGHAARRLNASSVLIGGFTIAAIGLALLAFSLRGDSYAVALLPGLIISGIGHGVIYTSMFILATHDVPYRASGSRRGAVDHFAVPLGSRRPRSPYACAGRVARQRQLPQGIPVHCRCRDRRNHPDRGGATTVGDLAASPAETNPREQEVLPQGVSV